MIEQFNNGLSKEFDYFIALKIAINQRLNINTAEIDAPYFTESNKDKAE